MKRSLWGWLTVLTMVAAAMAAVPSVVNYQGYLTATDGSPLDTTVAMTFTIYTQEFGGPVEWTELHSSVTVNNGIFDVMLGETTPLVHNNFWGGVWLGVTVGDNSEMTPRIKFGTSPYAYYVSTVNGASGGYISNQVFIADKVNVGTGNTNAGQNAFVAGAQNTASGDWSTVAGGSDNTAGAQYSAVGGGTENSSGGNYGVVGGGYHNDAQDEGCAIAGGSDQTAQGNYSFIGGGAFNRTTGNYSAIAGGQTNTASGSHSAVGGGANNRARGTYSVIAGGGSTTVADTNSTTADYAVIGGGYHNSARGFAATIAGGYYHTSSGNSATVGGGYRNTSTNYYTTVGGGSYNDATGQYATVPGGYNSDATGDYSFAAGRRAKAPRLGSFRWADATNADFNAPVDTLDNTFAIRSTGGVYVYTNAALTAGSQIYPGGSAWNVISDSTKKQNIRMVDTKDILNRVAQVPIKQWSYKAQDAAIEHIGPMAQDFWAAFHLGEDSLGISTIDPDGIALAAIQELAKQVNELREENRSLRTQIQTLSADQQKTEVTSTP